METEKTPDDPAESDARLRALEFLHASVMHSRQRAAQLTWQRDTLIRTAVAQGVPQQEIARRLGIGKPTVSRIVNNDNNNDNNDNGKR